MEADLRLILLGAGVLVILGILLDSYRRRRKINLQIQEFEDTILEGKPEQGSHPFFIDEDPIAKEVSAPRQVTPTQSDKPTQPPKPTHIVAVTIMPKQGHAFSGRALNAALQANQLKFGFRRIFHKHRGDLVEAQILFSLASLTEPGWFDLSKLVTSQFKGLIMFMDASDVHDPLPTFDKMLATARNISNALGAQLCDEARNYLSPQIIEHMKEKIRETQRRQLAREKSLDS